MLTKSGARSATPRAIYIGDLRESRGLHAMLRVAELAPNWEFDFIGGIAPIDQSFVDQWLRINSSASSRVHFLGKHAPIESWKFAQGAWVGLSLLESTPAFVDAMPSKLYEYMSVGLASISSPLPRCIEIIGQSKSGAIASSPNEVAEQLKFWEDNPAELDQIRNQASQWASEHLNSVREYSIFADEMVKLTR
jgi:glycosyltransferase involved in cell wall biosynthesis